MVVVSSSCGSSIDLLLFMAPVVSISCRSWLQWWPSFLLWLQYHLLLLVAPSLVVVRGSSTSSCRRRCSCGSRLQYLLLFVTPVSISCRSWLQYPLLLLVAPVSVICGSPVVSVSPVIHGSGSSSICRLVLWIQYLLLQWLQYWLCRSWLRWLVR